jgi:murein DD-endopeptidase MepM/ murein hydrolase activator NlpD
MPSQQHRSAYPERSSREPSSMQRALASQEEQASLRRQERGGGLFGNREPEQRPSRQPIAARQGEAAPFYFQNVQRPWLDDVMEPLGPFIPRSQSALATLVVSLLSLMVIISLSGMLGINQFIISGWSVSVQNVGSNISNMLGASTSAPNPPGNYNLRGAPSLNAAQADEILAAYGSPAHGTGRAWVEMGKRYNIDPAFALAFFIHESGAGTNPNWAGLKADGSTTHNVGNIICAGYATCYGRFRDYDSWETGIADWYRLIDVEYIEGRGTNTVAEIIPIYAPAFENDVNGYVRAVEQLVDGWRLQYGSQDLYARLEVPASAQPRGNPLNAINTVMTQDYGVGTHAPANVWGAIDLALDGNGDGTADPEGTQGRPIYATHDGMVKVSSNSYPAGNHVWVINEHYKTGYAHLQAFAVSEGQTVRRGDVIGYIGSTGQSSGPHLDYQVWTWQGNAWVNVNPQEYYVFERMQ